MIIQYIVWQKLRHTICWGGYPRVDWYSEGA